MQTPAPLDPKLARMIALREGLLFGTFAICLVFLLTACTRFIPVSSYTLNFVYIMAFIAFFVAGQRTAKKTNRIDMGALAGFWAGVAVAILGVVALVVLELVMYQSSSRIALSSLVHYVFSATTPAMLALIFGPAVGTLGGFINKIYAEGSVTQPTAPPQSSAPTVQPVQLTQSAASQPVPPAQPTDPAASQQTQP